VLEELRCGVLLADLLPESVERRLFRGRALMRTRLINTPLLDRELQRLERLLRPDGARQDLVSFMVKQNGQSEIVNGILLSKIIHRSRLPNVEIWLAIQKWVKSRK
jgi:hypothetical protein